MHLVLNTRCTTLFRSLSASGKFRRCESRSGCNSDPRKNGLGHASPQRQPALPAAHGHAPCQHVAGVAGVLGRTHQQPAADQLEGLLEVEHELRRMLSLLAVDKGPELRPPKCVPDPAPRRHVHIVRRVAAQPSAGLPSLGFGKYPHDGAEEGYSPLSAGRFGNQDRDYLSL